ncbi:MAG: hypothetical protein HIU90_04110 [Proteobacteria bacterium]|nr:hypothetical protein [Pseudomonadota bacterium]
MKQDRDFSTTTPPDRANSVRVVEIEAIIARHVAELRALAATPGQLAFVAAMASQGIRRGLSVGVAS